MQKEVLQLNYIEKIFYMISKIAIEKPDSIGVFASGLCLIHCLATPFLFVAKACSITCCGSAPIWWVLFDYLFLVIAFFAIYFIAKKDAMAWIKLALWASWFLLLAVLINGQLQLVLIPKYLTHLPAISLICLHLYNIRSC